MLVVGERVTFAGCGSPVFAKFRQGIMFDKPWAITLERPTRVRHGVVNADMTMKQAAAPPNSPDSEVLPANSLTPLPGATATTASGPGKSGGVQKALGEMLSVGNLGGGDEGSDSQSK